MVGLKNVKASSFTIKNKKIVGSKRHKHGNKTGVAKISICRFQMQIDLLSLSSWLANNRLLRDLISVDFILIFFSYGHKPLELFLNLSLRHYK